MEAKTAAEWLEELEAEETEWRRLLPGEKPVRGRLLAMLRDAKAELEKAYPLVADRDATAYDFAGWGAIEKNFAEGKYR